MSFGMGVGGKRRYVKPEDFAGRKVRSMGPVENPCSKPGVQTRWSWASAKCRARWNRA
jgi:hypothetical protein